MKTVIAIVGMPGSGKSEAANFFKEKGFPVLRLGAVIEEGIQEEGLSQTPENEEYYRQKIRKEFGQDAVAKKILPKALQALENSKLVILDGLYSWEEYIFLKNHIEKLVLLCIYASPAVRYQRLVSRKERMFDEEDAKKRDMNEIETLNKGGPIAMADYLIHNETTKEDLQKALETFFSNTSV
ncbi:MAG: AAA family ATPase [Candidatus Levyibacteriota bacterium]